MDAILAGIRPDSSSSTSCCRARTGLSLCRRLRRRGCDAVLMLTAKGDEVDRIVGLEVGADDYWSSPSIHGSCWPAIRAILRRVKAAARVGEDPRRQGHRLRGLIADLDARSVRTPDGIALDLTSAEFDLLACFLSGAAACCRATSCSTGRAGAARTRSTAPSMWPSAACAAACPWSRAGAAQLIKTVRNGAISSPFLREAKAN